MRFCDNELKHRYPLWAYVFQLVQKKKNVAKRRQNIRKKRISMLLELIRHENKSWVFDVSLHSIKSYQIYLNVMKHYISSFIIHFSLHHLLLYGHISFTLIPFLPLQS